MSGQFTYFIRIVTDRADRYYLKSSIDEQNTAMDVQLTDLRHCWTGKLDREQIRVMAKKFPSESHDSFYSHTQRAFSNGKDAGRTYIFDCQRLKNNRMELIWKEKVNDLNSLKTIGSLQLDEQTNEQILSAMFDYTIEQIEHQRSISEEKNEELQRTNTQLKKAIETIERTVDLKERLENDLFRKFALVLNEKKSQLAKFKRQLESSENNPMIVESDETLRLRDVEENTQSTATATLDHNKRTRDEDSDTDEDIIKPVKEQRSRIPPKFRQENREDSALDLGDDQMDYKTSTISKHHQRRRSPTNTKTMSTRPFVHTTSIVPTPSLPDESQTTDDWLNRI